MNLQSQHLFDDLESTLNSALEFLKGKESKLKELEKELEELDNEINFDLSKGLNVDKKKLKLEDLEKAFYEYEMKPADILIECTHINNINNCVAKINGERVKTYGEAKIEYIEDLQNKEKLAKIIANMEAELAKIKEETDIKAELRAKIVNSEMHINSVDSRIKLYEDTFKAFVDKEEELNAEIANYTNSVNSLVSKIEKDNSELELVTSELNSLSEKLISEQNEIENIDKEIENLNAKVKKLGPAITNDINILEDKKITIENNIAELNNNINTLTADRKKIEARLKISQSALDSKENNEPLISSNINFINTQSITLETYEDVNDLWKSKFSQFKDNVENLAKENKYNYSNANGESNTTLNPLIEYTDRLKNMIAFIQENDIIIDEHDEVEPEIIYREKPQESKLNPIVIGAIAIGGALILSNTK